MGALRRGRREANTPSGTPIATATIVEIATMSTCWAMRPASSAACDFQNAMTAMTITYPRVWGPIPQMRFRTSRSAPPPNALSDVT